jgi:hypothetical protein
MTPAAAHAKRLFPEGRPGGVQKVGGISPWFPLYPTETHLCGCKKRRRADLNLKPENQRKTFYETQP